MKRLILLPLFAAVMAFVGCTIDPANIEPTVEKTPEAVAATGQPSSAPAGLEITGPDVVKLEFIAAYSAPAVTGARFDHWEVDPGDPYSCYFADATYTSTTKIGFRKTGDFTITAYYKLTDNTTYTISKSVTSVLPFYSSIVGPDVPTLNTPTTYTVSPAAPAGWTFVHWVISGPGQGVFITSQTLTYTFTVPGSYYIYAAYTYPNGNGTGTSVGFTVYKEFVIR
jgi:hypothetical protein